MRVALIGTFDVGNFGDLLFPYVAEHKLREACPDVSVERFSYRTRRTNEWCYDVAPISALQARMQDFDCVIIGGGHLVHFSRDIAPGYVPEDGTLPHPLALWWLPAVAAAYAGVPVGTNALSVDARLPAWGDKFMASFVSALSYTGVRDPQSRNRLLRAQPDSDVQIVPDTIFSISELVDRAQPTEAFEAFRSAHGLDRPYVILQPSPGLRRFTPELLALVKAAQARGLAVLELPIGFELGNDPGFYPADWGAIQVRSWPPPLLLAEIIANAEASFGISLHLSIVSSCFDIPVFRPPYERESKFNLLDDLPNIKHLGQGAEFDTRSDSPVSNHAAISQHREALDLHWQRLAALASTRSSEKRSVEALWPLLAAAPKHALRESSLAERAGEMRVSAGRQVRFTSHAARRTWRRFRP